MENFEGLVIGSILLDNQCMATVEGIIQPEDFASANYAEAFRAIIKLTAGQSPVDVFTLDDELNTSKYKVKLGLGKISELQDVVPSAVHVEYYAQMVLDGSLKRKVRSLGAILELDDMTGQEAVEEAIKQLTSANQGAVKSLYTAEESINAFIRSFEERAAGNFKYQKTGFPELDEMIDGFVDGRIYVLGGRPGSGKTALALNFVNQATRDNVPTIIFNMEMPHEEVMGRLISIAGSVNHKYPNNMGDCGNERIVAGAAAYKDATLRIDDSTGYKVGHIKNSVRTFHKDHGRCFVVIDYLQLMRYDGDNANTGIGLITRELKALAKELKIPILILAQVNRGCETRNPSKPQPQASDLRDSGGIESDADCIMMCYRDEVYNPDGDRKGLADILIRKNRQGAIGEVTLISRLQFSQFLPMKTEFISQG